MTKEVTLLSLFEALRGKLSLEWVCGSEQAESPLRESGEEPPNQAWVGNLNLIHPNRIQIIGRPEAIYLADLSTILYRDALQQLFTAKPAAILIANQLEIDADLLTQATKNATPILRSPLADNELLYELHYHLTNALAEHQAVHGVFMEVMGLGVLITGGAGIGKSELALELIARGHRLIADDMAEFARIAPDILDGSCPPVLSEFLEVRGLGVINIRAIFGDASIKHNKYLRLIIHLERMNREALANMDRLRGSYSMRRILTVEVPQITIPVAPGRSLATLVEVAVRNHLLRLKGYDASEEFARRQQRRIESAP